MKKLIILLLAVFLLSGTVITATAGNEIKDITPSELITCEAKAGTLLMLFHKVFGPTPVPIGEDSKITVTKITEVTSKKTGEVTIFVEFDLSYDKPGVQCPEHGVDSYEMYKNALAVDIGVIKKSDMVCSDDEPTEE